MFTKRQPANALFSFNDRSSRFWLLSFTLLFLASVISWACGFFAARLDLSLEPDFHSRFSGGSLLIAGGGDLPPIIRQRFWELAGGKNGKLVIIPAYSARTSDVERLKGDWRGLRFASVQILQANSRDDAESAEFNAPLRNAPSAPSCSTSPRESLRAGNRSSCKCACPEAVLGSSPPHYLHPITPGGGPSRRPGAALARGGGRHPFPLV